MNLREDQLKRIYTVASGANIEKYLPWLNYFMPSYELNTISRISAFLAQVGHESGQLRYVEEIASGAAYENRKDLGNTEKGDGVKYKGRGLIQITGRANYTLLSKDLNVDFVNYPELITEPQYAVESAFWYWEKHNLNRYATLREDDFRRITRIINGGYNGYANRFSLWNKAKDVLSKMNK